MKKFLVPLLLSLFLCTSSAYALPFYLDLSGTGETVVDDGITDDLTEINFNQTSEILQDLVGGAITVGSSFSESGLGIASSFDPAGALPVDSAGLNTTFEMTFVFSGLSGTVTNVSGPDVEFSFANTGTIDVYIDDTFSTNTAESGGPINFTDPKAMSAYDTSKFTDGKKIASLSVLGGHGDLDTTTGQGDTFLDLKFIDDDETYGIWWAILNGTPTDLVKDAREITIGLIDTTQEHLNTKPGDPLELYVSGNGGLELVVPEPGTMMLLGFGLLGLARIGRRKSA